jgi:hypothetical protein
VQLALRADSYGDDPFRSPSNRRGTKALVAGVAVASAGIIAVNPVTPALPDIQERAVQLSAFANPLLEVQDTLGDTVTNLLKLGTNSGSALTQLGQSLVNPGLYAEFAEFVSSNALNPLPLLTELVNFPSNYGQLILEGNQASFTALQTALANLPTKLQNTINYLGQGQFVEAFSEMNIWFLVELLERPGRPLFPLFAIPGDIAASLPGGERLSIIFDTLLTRGTATNITKALLAPPITAVLQAAEILDDARAAIQAGDNETAVGLLVNMPIKVVNAFVNGFVPDFPTRSTFPGILSDGGLFDYFMVDLPKAIATALTAQPQAPAATLAAPAATALAPVAATDVSVGGGETVALTVDTASTATDSAAPAPEGDAAIPAGTEGDESETPVEGTDEGSEPAAGESNDDDSEDPVTDTDETDSEDAADEADADDEGSSDAGATDGDSDTGTSAGSDASDSGSDDGGSDSDAGGSSGGSGDE